MRHDHDSVREMPEGMRRMTRGTHYVGDDCPGGHANSHADTQQAADVLASYGPALDGQPGGQVDVEPADDEPGRFVLKRRAPADREQYLLEQVARLVGQAADLRCLNEALTAALDATTHVFDPEPFTPGPCLRCGGGGDAPVHKTPGIVEYWVKEVGVSDD